MKQARLIKNVSSGKTSRQSVKRSAKRKRKLRKNPEGLQPMSLLKQVGPGSAAFVATTTITGRIEALVSGAGIMSLPPPLADASTKQKIAAVAVPLASLVAAHFITKRYFQSHRTGILAGVGAAAAYKLIMAVLGIIRARQLGLGRTPDSTDRYVEPGEGPILSIAAGSQTQAEEEFSDLYQGSFASSFDH